MRKTEIIGFCGRLQSGKTTLANICEKYGYERIYFALPLKQLVGQLFNISIDYINKLKNVNGSYTLGDVEMKFLSDETDIPLQVIKDTLAKVDYTFKNTRQIMQFIGTDIIRAYNPNWHVDRLEKMLEKDKKYVIDDIRFPNELALIERLGGSVWYVVRPKLDNVSNHISETSIKWQDIGNVIVNDQSLELFQMKWDLFVSNDYETSLNKRNDIIKVLISDDILMDKFINSNNQLTIADTLLISRYEFTYSIEKIVNAKNIEIDNDGQNHILKIINEEDNLEIIKNPLIIEDYKFLMFE